MFFHGLPARPRYRLFLAAFLVVSGPLVGCGGDDDSRPIVPDGGTDGAVDGDAGGGNMMPGCMPPGTPEPTVQMCPGDSLPSLPNGACEVTPGNEATLITGDILVPGSVLRGGQVLIDESGSIACVDCDCSAMAGGATQVVCPDGVVSPGLINTHEHITFAQNVPFQPTDERWEHRHDWRRGLRGHSELDSMGRASSLQVSWGELRMMMGGATSLNGSGSADGFLRNLDRSAMEGLGQTAVEYDTFPLGDSDGTLLAMGCGYPGSTRGDEIAMEESYTPHLSEGIDTEAQNEFLCAREGEFDLIQPQTALIHGIGLTPPEIGEIAADQSSLIWSPRSNISLYGDTARITEYASLGVSIALGTDWVISGSMNMVRELACAADLNELYYGSYFTDEELWLMATRNAAEALAVDDVLGTIAVGSVADLAIFRSQDNRRDHRAIIESQAQDVVLVMRSGRPLYGDETLLTGFAGGDTCDGIDVCGSMKRICAQSEIGASLTDLQNANGSSYPLFFCGEPMNEPTCVPARNAMGGGIPSPEVNGSNRYSGAIEDGDGDGDGIPDATDNCQCTFNPIRPLDNGVQADFDGDGAGDACDPCPLDMGLSGCSPPDPNDRDGDGVPNDTDNCPSDQNANQADADNDMKGDVCDACPMDPNPGQAACPGTIYDVKDGTLVGGTTVALTGPIVTGVGGNGFFMQVGPMDPAYTGVDNSGVFVFTGDAPSVMPGNQLDIASAVVNDFFGQTQLTNAEIMVTGNAAIPAPEMVTSAEVTTGGARAAALEGVIVRLMNLTVGDTMPAPGPGDRDPTGEFEVDDMLRVDNFLYEIDPFPMTGEALTELTGILAFRNGNSKVEPRSSDDLIFGGAALQSLAPALSFARAGAGAGPTFPMPLTVRLTRSPAAATTVTLASSAGGLGVMDVVVPAGMREVTVPVTPVTASAAPYTITATLDGRMATADVRVIGAAEVPTTLMIVPGMASVPVNSTAMFDIELGIPAPPGGTTVSLSATAGTVPASIVVPANMLAAPFTFAAGATAGAVTITATAGAANDTAAVTVSDSLAGTLVINEVDYDQPGGDTTEFVELFNRGGGPIDLTGLSVFFINGNNSMEYEAFPLTGTLPGGGYLLIANSAVTAPAGVMVINTADSSIQNGAPDGICLVDTTSNMLIDALSYEGSITAGMAGGSTYNLVEGTALSASDPGAGSLARLPNGTDTDNADSDFALTATPTPGAANMP